MRFLLLALLLLLTAGPLAAQEPAILLHPARVFDGVDPRPHEGWSVLVRGERIEAAGPGLAAPAGARTVELPGMTLMPGMIEGHSHLFLHPYNETSWDDQVLKEPLALRTARAVNHARATLMAGFTTTRDLGTEGAGYSDVGLRQAIEQGIVPGPRMLVVTRAIVAGADTIEHGDAGTAEIFRLMKAHGTGYCPTLAATDAITRYRGWNGRAPEPQSIIDKRASFAAALAAGVDMCVGGDVGV